ncbi:hypothetical protein HN873_012119, partial [Arachis hypogaea]
SPPIPPLANLVSPSPSSSLSAASFLLPAVTASTLTSPCSEFINRPHQSTPKSPVTAESLIPPLSQPRLSVTLVVTLRGVIPSPGRHCFFPHLAIKLRACAHS